MFGSIPRTALAILSVAFLLTNVVAGGLEIKVLKEVPADKCIAAKKGDNISVHYTGSFEDGTQFDSSIDRGNPITFKLGTGRVIEGWEQGIEGMCIGEERQLTIPPELGYGSAGVGPIPGGATLVFVTVLVDIAGARQDDEL